LKSLNVKLMIDDFGTGYSSLSYLHQFPIDSLKVDQSFVQNLDLAQGGDEIVHAIISMAHHLQMQVTAEGIETPSQWKRIMELHCEQSQGYYLAKPLTPQEVEEMLQAGPQLPVDP